MLPACLSACLPACLSACWCSCKQHLTQQGSALSLVQDLPISKPCTASEINSLVSMADVPALCPYYLDLMAIKPRLAAAVDRMKALSSVVHVALCKVCVWGCVSDAL